MEILGTVKNLDKKTIDLTIDNHSTCNKCGLCSHNKKQTSDKMINIPFFDKNIKCGDRVQISINTNTSILYAFIIFILPILIMIISYMISQIIYSEDLAITISFTSLGISFLFIYLLNKYIKQNNKYKYKVIT
jgi:positive regulator of sigma E activity